MPTTFNPANEADRVRRYTSPRALERVEQELERNVALYASQSDEVIAQRIHELKQEWSINRALQVNVAATGLLGALLGLFVSRKWAVLTAGAFGFFLFHGLRGWEPPLPLLRQMGFRTRSEIDREIYALKAARGDFRDVPDRSEAKPVPTRQIVNAVNL